MTLKLITPPATEPVTLAEAKLHLRVTWTDEDALITQLIKAARLAAENELGRALISQTWEVVLDAFPGACVGNGYAGFGGGYSLAYSPLVTGVGQEIELGKPKVQSITSIKYIDTTGTEQTMDPATYSLDADSTPGWVLPAFGTSWPHTYQSTNTVRIRFVAGYGDATTVPESIKQWILLHVGTMYRNREGFQVGQSVTALPGGFFSSLLDAERVYL